MSDGTKIEWAANADGSPGASWNPIRARNRATGKVGWFCVHASPGCENCYAERINVDRFGNGVAYKAQNRDQVEIFLDENTLLQPLRWKKPRTIFVCSMTDLFADFVSPEMQQRVFAVMAICPQHTFIVLTKRSAAMREALQYASPFSTLALARAVGAAIATPRACAPPPFPLPNVWLGVSAETQREADARIPDLLDTPAAVRFASIEPLLAEIDLEVAWHGESALDSECWGECGWCQKGHPPLHNCQAGNQSDAVYEKGRSGLDWVIVGGESGRNARVMNPEWARTLRDQCASAHVPFFFKQWGEFAPLLKARDPDTMFRATKKIAGRVLDGRTHDERPPLTHQRSLP